MIKSLQATLLLLLCSIGFNLYGQQSPSNLFISEYIEGSSTNKALEFYNGTIASIDLTAENYVVQMYFNGSASAGLTIPLTGTIAVNGTFILAQSTGTFLVANGGAVTPNQTSSASWFNGDDAIVLKKGGATGTIVDAIGQIGFDPGTEWGTGLNSTADNTLRRKAANCAGDVTTGDIFDPSVGFDGFAIDTFNGLGSHTSSCTSSGSSIVLSPQSLNFNTTTGTSSAEQSYTLNSTTLTADVAITAPSNFEVSTIAGGPYSSSVTIPVATANAGLVSIYAIYNPALSGTHTGAITHTSGTVSASLNVQGTGTSGSITPVFAIQGSGTASPLSATTVTTQGLVTADFQGTTQLKGFYIQDTTGDGNSATSDGIFILNSSFDVQVGDYVRLTGLVDEAFTLTQIKNVSSLTILSSGNALIAPTNINLPLTAIADLEQNEGMLVKFPQSLTVTETFTLGRFGEVSLAADGRVFNPTNFIDPNDNPASGTTSTGTSNVTAVTAQQDLNNRRRILLDDASTVQNPAVIPYLNPADSTLRSGSTLANLTGVLDYAFSKYRLQPTVAPAFNYAARPVVPTVGAANVKIASFNVLNYFNGDGAGGGFPTARGANTLVEFNRQRTKIINAIKQLNADVVGLIEIENDGDGANSAIADLVNGLNAATASGTYAYILDAAGANGNPGTDAIKQAIIYKPGAVTPVGLAKTDIDAAHNRPPVAQTFTLNSNGEIFTAIVTHFKSKSATNASGANLDQGDGQGAYNASRKLQSTAFLNFITAIQTSSADEDVIAVGDYNAYEQEDPMDILIGGGLVNILPNTYSYVFDGQSGSLDHALTTASLSSKISGANKWHINADEPIAIDYNQEFNPASAYSPHAFRSSDHDPLLIGLNLQAPVTAFKLQLLHSSDGEGGSNNMANFAAVVEKLESQYPNTIKISSGDNWIPGPFFNASGDRVALDLTLRSVYNSHFGAGTSNSLRASIGRVDISVLNLLKYDASTFGNHEFDAGTNVVGEIVGFELSGTDKRWMGAQFPYLSANLDFSGDAALAPLFTSQILPSTAYLLRPDTLKSTTPRRKISPATIITVNGERIGVVGATTQILESISSVGGVKVKGSKTNNMAELATYLQPYIDQLRATGINKIIVSSHLQQIALEKQLVGLLHGVDIVIAGGSSTLLADANDVLFPGDIPADTYPLISQNADNEPALVVNVDQEWKYVGRLVVDFDLNGLLDINSLNSTINGVYATTDSMVTALHGSPAVAFAAGTKAGRVKTLIDAVNAVIAAKDGNILGKTSVYLNGRRTDVRTQETNLGDISNDANIAIGKKYDSSVRVGIKNGGGIRTSIGEVRVNPTTGIYEELPPQANPSAGKLTGDISQLDIENSLRFNNSLSLITVSATQLLQVLNHGVAAVAPGATPGQFPQIGGVSFSYNPSLPAGSRVRNAVIIDSAENILDVVVKDGIVQGDPARAIRVVTLTFLLTGGDGYPFNSFITANPSFANKIDLVVPGAPKTGAATFTDNGSEQDAFAEYLKAKYNSTPYNISDKPMSFDRRIQNLSVRPDSVLQFPTVSIINPSQNSVYDAGSPITLEAQASDANGSITKVEFYNAGVQFAQDLIAPYVFSSTGVEAGNYLLTAKAFDNSGNSSVSDTIRVTVTACSPIGSITAEGYSNISGRYISNLTSHPDYPNNPSITTQLSSFEYKNAGDNYGGRVRGYICAPATGNYTFYIASDDQSELYLSTNDDPANKRKIAFLNTPVASRSWYTYSTQKSASIFLKKGARYYIESLHKESTGSDHFAAAWKMPNGTFEGPILGSRLSPINVPVNAVRLAFTNGSQSSFSDLEDNIAPMSVLTAYPNPVKGPTSVKFILPEAEKNVTLAIYDANGSKRQELYSGSAEAGKAYTFTVDVNNYSGQLIIIRLVTPGQVYYFKLLKE